MRAVAGRGGRDLALCSPEDADKAANIVASQRIENIDAQLAQLLADASASADDFIQEAAQSVRLLECC